jgi:Secretion system C-terminal sorting domain
MKKRNLWLLAAVIVCFAAAKLEAQPNNYYMSLGASCDHGRSNQVINALGGADFVSVGTGLQAVTGLPKVTLSKHDALGNWIWSYEYDLKIQNVSGLYVTANGNSVAANPINNEYAILAYIAVAGGTPSQSVVLGVNATGNILWQTPIGLREATSIVYNPITNLYAVLSEVVNLGTIDLQLSFIAPSGALISSFAYGSGGTFNDFASRLSVNPSSGNYTMVGRSYNGTDNDAFVVHVNPVGAILTSQTFDFAGGDERGIDAVDWNASSDEAILVHDVLSDIIYLIVINDGTGIYTGVSSSVAVPPTLSNQTPTAITTDPTTNNLMICGQDNSGFMGPGTNAFVTVVDPSLAPLNYCLYGQPWWPGNENFKDLMYDVGTSQLIFAGEHERINSWPGTGSPLNQNYPWLAMANPLGNGACSMALAFLAPTPYTFIPTLYTNGGVLGPVTTPVIYFETTTTQVMLDECSNPFRVGGAGAAQPATATVYPNPATTEITIENSSETDLVFELTNALGEQVMNKSIAGKTGKMLVDISGVNPGIYFYRIYNGATTITTEKLIITR